MTASERAETNDGEETPAHVRFLTLAVQMGEIAEQVPDLILAAQERRRAHKGHHARCGDLLVEFEIVDRDRVGAILDTQHRFRQQHSRGGQVGYAATRSQREDARSQDTVDRDVLDEKIAGLEQKFRVDMTDNDWELLFHDVKESLERSEFPPDPIAWIENRLRRKLEMDVTSRERRGARGLRIFVWASGLAVIASGLADRLGLAVIAVLLCAIAVAIQIRWRGSCRA